MIYTKLGRTGLKVSRLCLGTMNFGSQTGEKESFRIMDRALELGINFFDTSNNYGDPLGNGITEEIIGHWFAQGGGRRDKVILATKLYCIMGPGPNDRGLSAYHIRKACSDSLRRLQTDRIELYQMHHIDRGGPRTLWELNLFGYKKEIDFYMGSEKDYSTPWEEIWQGMEQLVREGKIIYTGSCNFAGWNIAHANGIAKMRNFMGLACEQSIYNLSNRMIELEVIPACRKLGLGLIPWSPLGGGLLAGALNKAKEGRRSKLDIKKHHSQIEAYEKLCKEIGEEPANIALSWLLYNPVVTAPIIGPRTVQQLEDSVNAFNIELKDEILMKLDEIWPGPGGEAPEAYSW
ncbi:aldo/keto reductase [Actinomycetota bacterium]